MRPWRPATEITGDLQHTELHDFTVRQIGSELAQCNMLGQTCKVKNAAAGSLAE